jgi:hypothetical protein
MDDQAPIPVAPLSVDIPAIEEDQSEANVEDLKTSQAYWHPAWSKVQDMFEAKLEAYKTNGAVTHADLPAEEFKIRLLTDAHVAAVIEEIMEDVKRAVESVESTKRRTTGGK